MPRIVIVGAGPAGVNLAQGLAKQLTPADNTQVLVLEKSKFYYHAVGVPRAYVEPAFAQKLFIPYDKMIPKEAASFVTIQRAIVTRILPDSNELQYIDIGPDDAEAGPVKAMAFDYLVLATGSTYIAPINQPKDSLMRSETEGKLRLVSENIVKADKILVVGGGAVGCEVAGEIKSKYPMKQVTLLDAKAQLVSGANVRDKFRIKLKRSMEKLDIKLVLGEQLEERLTDNVFLQRTLRTDKGTEIESDIQLLCVGFSPTADLVEDLDQSLVTSEGAIKVNDQLQLDNVRYHHVFALGDSSNHSTPKMAYWAGEQGKFLATQFAAVLHKKQSKFSTPFTEVKVGSMLLPLGPNGGVSQLPLFGGMVMGDMTTRAIKSKDYFASLMWQSDHASGGARAVAAAQVDLDEDTDQPLQQLQDGVQQSPEPSNAQLIKDISLRIQELTGKSQELEAIERQKSPCCSCSMDTKTPWNGWPRSMSYAKAPPAGHSAPMYQSDQASGYGFQATNPYSDYSYATAFDPYPPVSVHTLRPRPSSRCRFLTTTLKLVVFHILNTLLGEVGVVLLVTGLSLSIGLLPLCCFGLVVFRLVLYLVSGLAKLDVALYNFVAPPDQHVHLQLPPPDLLIAGDRLAPKLSDFSPKALMALFYLLTVKFVVSILSAVSVTVAMVAPVVVAANYVAPDSRLAIQLGDDAIWYDSAPAAFVIATACLTIIGVALMHAVASLSRTTTLFFCCEKFSYYSPVHSQSLEAYEPVSYGSKGY